MMFLPTMLLTSTQGSVCAYISSVLHAAGVPSGRFTSPHLVDRWDCITLNETTVDKDVFLEAEAIIKATDARLGIGATEFELLTATAFEIFSKQKIDVAVVEVGMGGRLDSTNVFENPLATVITKIAMDHMGFLGFTLEEIAREKAGIMKNGSPCIVDGSNTETVLSVLNHTANEVGVREFVTTKLEAVGEGYCEVATPAFGGQRFTNFLTGLYQPWNLACAVNALSYTSKKFPSITAGAVEQGIMATRWPGRMETVDVSSIVDRGKSVLVDGAHNPQAADSLAEYVDQKLRAFGVGQVAWVLAASEGKDIDKMLRSLLRCGDHVVGVKFGPVDGMPWVSPMDSSKIVEAAEGVIGDLGSAVDAGSDIKRALSMACQIAHEGSVVVAGSLWGPLNSFKCFGIADILNRRYLAGDVIRLARLT